MLGGQNMSLLPEAEQQYKASYTVINYQNIASHLNFLPTLGTTTILRSAL